jgi:hypothetical protein
MNTHDKHQEEIDSEISSNKNRQGIDKNPGEEKGNIEVVKPDNLKGKKVDGFPDSEIDTPLNQIP